MIGMRRSSYYAWAKRPAKLIAADELQPVTKLRLAIIDEKATRRRLYYWPLPHTNHYAKIVTLYRAACGLQGNEEA